MPNPPTRAPWIAVGLISGSALAYEVLLTRLFAVVHWSHLIATVISLALLGYGASGTFLSLAQGWLRGRFAGAFLVNAGFFALAMPVCFLAAQAVPLDPQVVGWEPAQLWNLAAVYLILALPFFGAANCVGLALWQFRTEIPRLYSIDLLGAGAGALVVVVLLESMHPGYVLPLLAGLGGLGAMAAAVELRRGRMPVAVLSGAFALGLVLVGPMDVRPAGYKDLARALAVVGASVETTRSGAMGVVTVVRNDEVPLRAAPGMSLLTAELPPEQRAVFVDGEAAGRMDRSTPESPPGYLRELVSALPYALVDEPSVLVVGAGAGSGVVQALAHGARRVVAVEPDPQLVELPCRAYRAFTASCEDERVSWRVEEPRAFLAGEPGAFDVIAVEAHPDLAGTDALREAYALTVEAFADYFDHLASGGVVAVSAPTRLPPRLSLRLVDTARAALARVGVERPADHLAMIRGWQRFTLIVSARPLGAERIAAVRRFARDRAFDLVWLPDIVPDEVNRVQRLAEPFFHRGVAALLDASAGARDYAYAIAPATDDRPYALRFTRFADLLGWPDAGEVMGGSRLDAGLVMGAATLVQALAAGLVFILLPLVALRGDRRIPDTPWRWRTPAFFALIGLGFLSVEIAWIQRLQLFLGHPVYATAVVLATFLVFAGLGSMSCQRLVGAMARRRLIQAVAAILAIGLLYIAGLGSLLVELADWPVWARVLAAVGLVAPLAFAMGMPFPIALRTVAEQAPGLVPWAWAVNGCASVVSAVAAPLVAVAVGFSGLLLIGVSCYLLLPAVFTRASLLNGARLTPSP